MSKTKTINEQGLKIEWSISNDSFDYQGPNRTLTHKLDDYPEIESISVFIEYTGDWLDVSNDKTMIKLAENLVNEAYQSRRQDHE